MKKFFPELLTKHFIIIIAIFSVAIALRTFKLNQIPHGFYWDEAAITYNAWGISIWNRDEFGNKLPVSFKSFGDYKAPLLIYSLASIYKVVGLRPELLRISIALCGIVSVGLMYLIALELENIYKLSKNFKYATAFFMAVLPWAVQFSRIGVEATLALMLVLAGFYALLKTRINNLYWLPTAVCFGLSLYAYHSAKIFIPLFLVSLLILKKVLYFQIKPILAATVIITVISLPFINDTIKGQGFERGKTMIFFNNKNGAAAQLATNIKSYLSPNFWFLGKDAIGLRHSVPGHGVIFFSIGTLFLFGLVASFKKNKQLVYIMLAWFFVGLMPSLLTNDAPHAIRSMLVMPPIVFVASMGLINLFNYSKWLGMIAALAILVESSLYTSAYYTSYATQSATAFQFGYKQAILYAESIGKGADKIIVSDKYGQPYIYTLLYRKLTPEEFKFGALANYEFHSINWPDERPNRVYVATPAEINPQDPAVVKIITIPDTSIPVFVIAKT